MLIYLMVDNFKQITGAVNTKPQPCIFVAVSPYQRIVVVVSESIQNILAAKTMPERGFVKLNNLPIHTFIV